MTDLLDIYLVTAPGLESLLAAEAAEAGFTDPVAEAGGVTVKGQWPDVWRANLTLRGASRVLVRIGGFRAMHLAQLDKRARKFPWEDTLRKDVPIKVEMVCRKSKIYHDKAATQRVARSARQIVAAPTPRRHPDEQLFDFALLERPLEGRPARSRTYAAVDRRPGLGMDDVPRFRLGVGAGMSSRVLR